jgi:hypothetical protein
MGVSLVGSSPAQKHQTRVKEAGSYNTLAYFTAILFTAV